MVLWGEERTIVEEDLFLEDISTRPEVEVRFAQPCTSVSRACCFTCFPLLVRNTWSCTGIEVSFAAQLRRLSSDVADPGSALRLSPVWASNTYSDMLCAATGCFADGNRSP